MSLSRTSSLTLTISGNTLAGSPRKALWTVAADELTPEDKQYVDFFPSDQLTILNSVLAATEEKKRECLEKRWKYTNRRGEKIVIRDLIDKIIVWVDKFKSAGDMLMQYDSAHAALPWAGIRFFLQLAVDDCQAFGSVLEGMELIAHLVNRYAIIEDLYLREDLPVTEQLKQAIIKMYATVLRYLSEAKRYYSQNTAKRMAKSMVQLTRNDFASHLDAITREQSSVDHYARLVDAEYQRAMRKTMELGHLENYKGRQELMNLLEDLEKPINRVSFQLAELHDNLQASKRREILKWISSMPYEQHHWNVRRYRLEKSCLWLFGKEEFRMWRKSSASSILWLHGIPGSGKSILVSLVIDDVLESNLKNTLHEPLAYFYCARDPSEPERGNPLAILSSLVRQLSCLKPGMPIMAPIISKYTAREESNFGFTNLSLDECVQLILDLSGIYPSMTIIIDAIDECDPNTRLDLLEALDDILQRSAGLVKVFVSSRDDNDIVCRLENSPNLYVGASDSREDIERYVKVEVEKSIQNRKLLRGCVSKELRELTVTTLIDGAQGMFRWASLQLQNLCNPRRMKVEDDVREELGRLPEKLADIYAEVYEQIFESGPKSQLIAERALRWLICGQRRLSSSEFLAAVSLGLKGGAMEVSKQHILDICCNLIVHDPDLDTFRFTHLSVREYLETRREYKPAESHAVGAEASLFVFVAKDLSEVAIQQVETLRQYATLYWPLHCQISAGRRSEGRLEDLFQDFFWQHSDGHTPLREWSLGCRIAWRSLNYGEPVKEMLKSTLSSPPNPLFVACAFGFTEVVEKLLRTGDVPLEELNDPGESPLYVASRNGHYDIVSAMLAKGADVHAPSGEYGNALQAAAYGGAEAVVKLLLEYRVDANVCAGRYGYPLQAAAEQGNATLVKLLLGCGANVNAEGGYYGSSLRAGVWSGNQTVVKLLLRSGADVNAQRRMEGSALQLAAERNDAALVRLLINYGADVNAAGGRCGDALKAAAERGNLATVSLLLSHNANINAQGGRYENALRAAVWGGNEAVVSLLLDNGADVNLTGGKYGNALQAAAWGDKPAVVKLLIDRGADVNALGGLYGNALQAAAVVGSESAAKILLEHGASVNAECGLFGNALQAAAERGNDSVAKLLLDHGVDIDCERGVRGTALQAASWGGNESIVKLLCDNGINVRANGGVYGNALQMAALRGKEEVVELLIDKIGIHGTGGKYGNTLQAAVWGNSYVVVKQVIERGADVNARGGLYETALQAAATVGNVEVVKLLLEHGADINVEGGYYGNALQAAIEQCNEEAVQLLESVRNLNGLPSSKSEKSHISMALST